MAVRHPVRYKTEDCPRCSSGPEVACMCEADNNLELFGKSMDFLASLEARLVERDKEIAELRDLLRAEKAERYAEKAEEAIRTHGPGPTRTRLPIPIRKVG